MDALNIKNLTMNFGGLRALNKVTLSVKEGERRGIIGPNGAGKTTFFNVVCGYLTPSHGSIQLLGKDVIGRAPHRLVRMGLGRTFQKMNIFSELSVRDNIRLSLSNKKIGLGCLRLVEPEIIVEGRTMAERFGLYEKWFSPAKYLSYGEQRILEILLALALKPKLILLDEPMAGLSAAERTEITKVIKQLPKDITIVLIEHDLDVLFDITESITVLHYGSVIADGSNSSILNDSKVQDIYLSRTAQNKHARN